MKKRSRTWKDFFAKHKDFILILSASVSVAVLTLLDWGKVIIANAKTASDTGIRFTVLSLLDRVTDIARTLRYLSIGIATLPLIKTLIGIGQILMVGSFLMLAISLFIRQKKTRAKWACFGFFTYALVVAAMMAAAPIVDNEVEIASKGIVTSIIRLTAFPYVSFSVSVLSLLLACRSAGHGQSAYPMTTRKLAISGVLAAFVLLMTIIIKIPIPATGGYVHPGDGVILFSALLLGPYAAMIGGIGSALADLLGGYAVYALPTFLIKAMMGGLAGFLVRDGKTARNMAVFALSAALMVLGYYVAEGLMFSYASAVASVIPNLLQGAAAVAIGVCLSFSIRSLKRVC